MISINIKEGWYNYIALSRTNHNVCIIGSKVSLYILLEYIKIR